ncbi:MAG TPA: threonine/serine dehydratase [Candidatus Limnocylindrales bacterium]|nr:threonine/serine dehydratase [Candidatus Limnocylindrales bacterium]
MTTIDRPSGPLAIQPAPEAAAELVTIDDIRGAAERIAGVALRSPLLPFGPPDGADPLGRPRVWLKAESLQPIGAFKIRGAMNAISQLAPEQRAAGVISHSSGNHAQAVARVARLLGVRAVIVMPSDAPALKVARVRADGAEVVVVGPSSDERAEKAAELAARDGLTLVPPYDDPAIIAGQGTCGLEIVEQVEELDAAPMGDIPSGAPEMPPPSLTVLVQISGGGLSSGVATAVKSLRPDAHVFGVEPAVAADARDSLREGRIVRWDPELTARTIADGQRATQVGRLPFAHLRRYLDGIIAVEEVEIRRAMARAARDARLVLEPSGATALAAWLFHAAEVPREGRVVCVLSGGNVDPERYATFVAEGMAAGG